MSGKPTKNQAHIKAYLNASDEQRIAIRKILDKYLIYSDDTLGSIAVPIGNILNSVYDRKK